MPLICKKRRIIKSTDHIGGDLGTNDTVGGDITSSIISKIPYELHLRDTSFKKI